MQIDLLMKGLFKIPIQKRIVVYFVLGIVLPSIIMGGLALRGIRNDQALIERENARQVRESGALIIEFTEGILLSVERNFNEQLPQQPVSEGMFFSDSAIAEFTLNHPMVHGIFYVDEEYVLMLDNRLQYLPKYAIKTAQNTNLKASAELETGWKYEFQDRNMVHALSFYQELMADLTDGHSKAIALNSIARLHKKTGDIKQAAECYVVLSRDYADYRINKAMPLGLVADAELTHLRLEQGDTIAAIRVQQQILQNLIHQKWELDVVSYLLFSNKCLEFIQTLKGHTSSHHTVLLIQLDSLREKQEMLQVETRILLSMHSRITDNLSEKIRNTELNKTERWNDEASGINYLISSQTDTKSGHWCLLMSTDKLLSRYVIPRLERAAESGRWHWIIKSNQGATLAATKENVERAEYVQMSFPSGLPEWTMFAFVKPLSPFQAFFQSGQGVYLYIFLFIGAVLVVGLLFIMYSINRELQITKMKSDFVATVSHEFKSPITAIRQITEMLQSGRVPPERREKYYAVMLQQGARLTHLIDNILDSSRIEKGKRPYIFEETNVAELLQNIVGRYENSIEDKDFQINLMIFPELQKVNVDSEAIRQALYNLLDNAVKYSGNSKVIDICVEQNNGTIVTSIRDYGIGISKEEQGKIFERFYRAGNIQTHHIKGSGIGLSLVKKIIEAHGGRTEVDSAPDKGSTFYLFLPVHKN